MQTRLERRIRPFVLIGIVCSLLGYLSIAWLPADDTLQLVREDGPIEWLGALAWCAAGVLLLASTNASVPLDRLRRFWIVALALVCLLAAGEEISWGQRVFGFDTPSALAAANVQGETNLHNLYVFDGRLSADGSERRTGFAKWLTFGTASKLLWIGYLVVLPLVASMPVMRRRLVDPLRLPTPPVAVALWAALSYLASRGLSAYAAHVTTISNPDALAASSGLAVSDAFAVRIAADEIHETVVAVLFLVVAMTVLRAHRRSVAGSPSGWP